MKRKILIVVAVWGVVLTGRVHGEAMLQLFNLTWNQISDKMPELAEAVGTPFYCYSSATLTRHYKVFEAALPKGSLVAFSVKANGNLAVLKTLGNLGAGADVVSEGELRRARHAGSAGRCPARPPSPPPP